MIREHLDGDSLLPFALAVYVALTENASDQCDSEFVTLQSHVARLAGNISTKTVQRVLPLLREVGVLEYTTPRLRGPLRFRLLSVASDSLNDATNSPYVATGEIFSPSRTIEVTMKNGIEGTKRRTPASGDAGRQLLLDAARAAKLKTKNPAQRRARGDEEY